MKKFQFHLEKLLSYKGQMLDSEMMTLAVLNKQLRNAQQTLLALRIEREKCKTDFETKVMGKTTPAACQVYIRYTEYLKEQIKQSEKDVKDISVQVDNQIEIIKNLKIETKSLETLKTSRLDDYKKEDIKKAELQLEEFVSTAKIITAGY